MNKALTVVAVILAVASVSIGQPGVSAGRCPSPDEPIPPNSETREIRTENMEFEIPANYRTIKYGVDKVEVVDPGEYDYRQCVTRNRVATDSFLGIWVSREYRGANIGGHNWMQGLFSKFAEPIAQSIQNPNEESIGQAMFTVKMSGLLRGTHYWYFQNDGPGTLIEVNSPEIMESTFDVVVETIY